MSDTVLVTWKANQSVANECTIYPHTSKQGCFQNLLNGNILVLMLKHDEQEQETNKENCTERIKRHCACLITAVCIAGKLATRVGRPEWTSKIGLI